MKTVWKLDWVTRVIDKSGDEIDVVQTLILFRKKPTPKVLKKMLKSRYPIVRGYKHIFTGLVVLKNGNGYLRIYEYDLDYWRTWI